MQNITSFQIISALIAFLLGFICRMGLFWEHKRDKVKFITIFFMFIFSLTTSCILFIFGFEKQWSNTLTIIIISIASFFGSEVIPGLGAIKASFFTSIFKDMLKKWILNSDNSIENGETEENKKEINEANDNI